MLYLREEKSYELQWLEAEVELAISEYKNNVWLPKQLMKENKGGKRDENRI